MDRLTSMAVFVGAIDEGSLTAAARRFGLSASMAGKHVASIEADLKVRLLQRSTRSLVLTEAGRTYYARCKRLLEDYDNARREASNAREVASGLLRIAAPVTFGEMYLSDVIRRYMSRYPEVSVDISLDDRYVDVLREGVDVAIRIGRLPDSDLIARRLAPCKMVFCASPDFIEQHGEPRSIDDLRRAPRLAFRDAVSAGDWSIEEQDGTRHIINGPVRMLANNMKMLLAAALGGAGITYGPTFVFERNVAEGRLVVLMPDLATAELAVHAVYPTNRYVTLKLRSFVDHLVSEFSNRPL